jgi:ERCC4-type nuclease
MVVGIGYEISLVIGVKWGVELMKRETVEVSIKELVNADEIKLQEVEGIGKLRAKFLVEFFKREYKNL